MTRIFSVKNSIPFFIVTLFAALSFADYTNIVSYDFEGVEPNSYWRSGTYTSITTDPAEVISGSRSLKVDTTASASEWNEVFHTLTGSVPLQGGKRYSILFNYTVLQLTDPDSYFYTLARSQSGSGPDKGWTPWTECPDNPSYHEIKVLLPAGVDDYRVIFGVHKKGAIILDSVIIREMPSINTLEEGVTVSDSNYEPYGMNVHFDLLYPDWGDQGLTDAQVVSSTQTLADAGVQWLRALARWDSIEHNSRGAVDSRWIARQDLIADTAIAHGLKLQVLLCATPQWASEAPGEPDYWAYAPYDMNDWKNFVALMANRLKNKVTYWEIGNEVDTSTFWKSDMTKYAEFLKVAYNKLKEIDPNNKVILAGLATDGIHLAWEAPYVPGVDEYVLQKLYDAGIKNYFDILAIHPYTNVDLENNVIESADKINTAYEVMLSNGDGHKPIWVNELGMSTEGIPDNLVVQADYLEKLYTELIKHPKVDKIFWYTFRCYLNSGAHENNFGIVDNNFSELPAYYTLQDLEKADVRKVNYGFIPEELLVDFETDGHIDNFDIGKLCDNWLMDNCIFPQWCQGTDLNHNSMVTFEDLAVFAEYWLEEYRP